MAAREGTAQDAEQRADGKARTDREPWLEALPGPAVHANLTPFAAFPSAHQHGPARPVKIALAQRERLADPQTRAPEHDDHAAQADPIGVIARGTHHRDDLLDGRWVWRVAETFVARGSALIKARHGCR